MILYTAKFRLNVKNYEKKVLLAKHRIIIVLTLLSIPNIHITKHEMLAFYFTHNISVKKKAVTS